ncbi:hem peroxidase family protein [Synechococcus sp. SYN20]|nr:hem peroxidase family protein [Synechococcus sp. SYN20]
MLITSDDLLNILQQIQVAEAHSSTSQLARITALIENGQGLDVEEDRQFLANLIPGFTESPTGLRTVDGTLNNLQQGQGDFGAADRPYSASAELVTSAPQYGDSTPGVNPFLGVPGPPVVLGDSYAPTTDADGNLQFGDVNDAGPRRISNLIADTTTNNPAAAIALQENLDTEIDPLPFAGKNLNAYGEPVDRYGRVITTGHQDGNLTEPLEVNVRNVAPDPAGAPYNAFLTLFAQGFDHGLGHVEKGGEGTIYVPLDSDDPLYVEGSHTNFMVLSRATRNAEGGIDNQTTPWIDMNQAYGNISSQQVFLREYTQNSSFEALSSVEERNNPLITGGQAEINFGQVLSTGKFLNGQDGNGLPTWADVKNQATTVLGIELTDSFVSNIPLVAADKYGKFTPGENGLPQIVFEVLDADGVGTGTYELLEGNQDNPLSLVQPGLRVVQTGQQFLIDINQSAEPMVDGDNQITNNILFDVNGNPIEEGQINPRTGKALNYDEALLDAHLIGGDGRTNENIGLLAFHVMFHNEHDRLVEDYKRVAFETQNPEFISLWLRPSAAITEVPASIEEIPADAWDGERLFQASRFMTEMQYQHGVFEDFVRANLDPAIALFAGYQVDVDPAITQEFSHAVYRYGHSMLTPSVDRFDLGPDGEWQNNSVSLIEAFLNPRGALEGALVDPTTGVADPINGVAKTLTSTEAAASILRGMTTQQGNAIDEFVTSPLRSNLLGMPLDLATINIARGRELGIPKLNETRRQFFEATDGNSSLTPYSSWADFGGHLKHYDSLLNFVAAYGTHSSIEQAETNTEKRTAAAALIEGSNADARDFMLAQGDYADRAGVDDIDLWIGGLAERPEDAVKTFGTTFALVFEQQMVALQNSDRFYYLARLTGNLNTQIERNTFASMATRALDGDISSLAGNIFTTPYWTLEIDKAKQNTNLGPANNSDPTGGAMSSGLEEVHRTSLAVDPANVQDGEHTTDQIGIEADNVLRYNGAVHVTIGGSDQNDLIATGPGNDTVYGRAGDDTIYTGMGDDQVFAGDGNDFVVDSEGENFMRGEAGNDVMLGGMLLFGGMGDDWLAVSAGGEGGETFGETGHDFMLGSNAGTFARGGDGNDWFEGRQGGADEASLDDGEAVNALGLFVESALRTKGHDVSMSKAGDDSIQADEGNDIFIDGSGDDRYDAGSGFDWLSFARNGEGVGAGADAGGAAFSMSDQRAAGLGVAGISPRVDDSSAEAVSGSMLADQLLGSDLVEITAGNQFLDLNEDGVLTDMDGVLDSDLQALRDLGITDFSGPGGAPDGVVDQFDIGVIRDWNDDSVVDENDLTPITISKVLDASGNPVGPEAGLLPRGVAIDAMSDNRLFDLPLNDGGIDGLFSDVADRNFSQLIPNALIQTSEVDTVFDAVNEDSATNLRQVNPFFNGGDVIIGGAHGDTIYGFGGDDVLDGDAHLEVKIKYTAPEGNIAGLEAGTEVYFSDMAEINADNLVLNRVIKPTDLEIHRALSSTQQSEGQADVAAFIGSPDEFLLEGMKRVYVNNAGEPVDSTGLLVVDIADAVTYIEAPGTGAPVGYPLDGNGQPMFIEDDVNGVPLSSFDLVLNVPVGTTFINQAGLASAFPKTRVFGADGVAIDYTLMETVPAVLDPDGAEVTPGSGVFSWSVTGFTADSVSDTGFDPNGDELHSDLRSAGDGFLGSFHHPTAAQALDPARTAQVGLAEVDQGYDFMRNFESLRFVNPILLDPTSVEVSPQIVELDISETFAQTASSSVVFDSEANAANIERLREAAAANSVTAFAQNGPQAPNAPMPAVAVSLFNDTGASDMDAITADAAVVLDGRTMGTHYEISFNGEPETWVGVPVGLMVGEGANARDGLTQANFEALLKESQSFALLGNPDEAIAAQVMGLQQGSNSAFFRLVEDGNDAPRLGDVAEISFIYDTVSPVAPVLTGNDLEGFSTFAIEDGAVLETSTDDGFAGTFSTNSIVAFPNAAVRQTDVAGNMSAVTDAAAMGFDDKNPLVTNASYYSIANGSLGGALVTSNGMPVNESNPGGGWEAHAAIQTADGFDLFWENSLTGEFAKWELDSNAALVDGQFLNAESFYQLESALGTDLNSDVVIGLEFTSMAAGLATFGSTQVGYAISNSDGLHHITYGGGTIASENAPGDGWKAHSGIVDEATGNAQNTRIFWENEVTGQFANWSVSATGDLLEGAFLSDEEFFTWESVSGQDLNSDGVTGLQFTNFSPGSSFGSNQLGYAFLSAMDEQIQVTFSGGFASESSPGSGWEVVDYSLSETGFSLLWENQLSSNFATWDLDPSGELIAGQFITQSEFNAFQNDALMV